MPWMIFSTAWAASPLGASDCEAIFALLGNHGAGDFVAGPPCAMAAAICRVMSFTTCLKSSVATRGLFPAPTSTARPTFEPVLDVGGDHALPLTSIRAWRGIWDILANFGHHRDAVGLEIRGRVAASALGDIVRQMRANMSLRATKSVCELTSTRTPRRPPGAIYWAIGAFAGFAPLWWWRWRRPSSGECQRRRSRRHCFGKRLLQSIIPALVSSPVCQRRAAVISAILKEFRSLGV